MKKFAVYGTMSARALIGTYDADSEEDAIKKAEEDQQANWMPSICHQCSNEIELGEIYETEAVELTDE